MEEAPPFFLFRRTRKESEQPPLVVRTSFFLFFRRDEGKFFFFFSFFFLATGMPSTSFHYWCRRGGQPGFSLQFIRIKGQVVFLFSPPADRAMHSEPPCLKGPLVSTFFLAGREAFSPSSPAPPCRCGCPLSVLRSRVRRSSLLFSFFDKNKKTPRSPTSGPQSPTLLLKPFR